MGCEMAIEKQDGEWNATGNLCPKGLDYAIREMVAPVRTVTSCIRISKTHGPLLPVKTDQPIPKEMIFPVMALINSISVEAPVRVGDIIVSHILGTEANLVATKSMCR